MTLSSNEVWDVIFLLLLARSTAQKLFRHLSSSSSSHNKFNNNAFYAHCVRTSLLLRNNNRLYNLLSRHKSLATPTILLSRAHTFEPVQDLVSAPAFFIMTARAYYLHLLIWLLNTLHIECATWQWERKCGMAACVLQPEFLLFTLCLQLEAISLSYATLYFHPTHWMTDLMISNEHVRHSWGIESEISLNLHIFPIERRTLNGFTFFMMIIL